MELKLTTSIIIQNLKCGGCAKTIASNLSEIENISNIGIDIEESKISFNYLNTSDLDMVQKKLLALGYPSIGDENSVLSKAKSFVSCATGKIKN